MYQATAETSRPERGRVPCDQLAPATGARARRPSSAIGRRPAEPQRLASTSAAGRGRSAGRRAWTSPSRGRRGSVSSAADEHVVEPVVAVHDRRRAAERGSSRPSGRVQLVDARAARGCARRPAACPSGAPAGPGSPRGGRSRPGPPRPGRRRAARPACPPARSAMPAVAVRRRARRARRPVRYGDAVDELHHVEGRAEHARGPRRAAGCAGTGTAVRCSALITRYSRAMSCAVARTCPSGGRRTTQRAAPSVTRVGEVGPAALDQLGRSAGRRPGPGARASR